MLVIHFFELPILLVKMRYVMHRSGFSGHSSCTKLLFVSLDGSQAVSCWHQSESHMATCGSRQSWSSCIAKDDNERSVGQGAIQVSVKHIVVVDWLSMTHLRRQCLAGRPHASLELPKTVQSPCCHRSFTVPSPCDCNHSVTILSPWFCRKMHAVPMLRLLQ